MEGRAPVVHLCTPPLQTSIRVSKNVGSVALLTSDKPLPQAEDDTNHRKANTAVNPRSLLSSKKYMSLQNKETQLKCFQQRTEQCPAAWKPRPAQFFIFMSLLNPQTWEWTSRYLCSPASLKWIITNHKICPYFKFALNWSFCNVILTCELFGGRPS